MLLYFFHGLASSFITIMVLFCCRKDRSLAKKLSEFLEPCNLSELWEPLCRTDGSNPYGSTSGLVKLGSFVVSVAPLCRTQMHRKAMFLNWLVHDCLE